MDPSRVPKILIPGREKYDLGEHQVKWDEAAKCLESAENVVFLGYGLPESDANAREFLLKHLRKNEATHLTIEIVLGEPNFRTQRLEATLRQALAHRVHSEEDRTYHRDDLRASRQREADLLEEKEAHSRRDTHFQAISGFRAVREKALIDQLLKQEVATFEELMGDFSSLKKTPIRSG